MASLECACLGRLENEMIERCRQRPTVALAETLRGLTGNQICGTEEGVAINACQFI